VSSVGDLLRGDSVLDLGPLPAPRLAPAATVQQALQFLARGRRGAVVVVEGLRPVGIFSERDVVLRLRPELFVSRAERGRTPVGEIMSRPPVTVRRQTTLAEAIETMERLQHRHLVVVDREGELRGLLTSNDIIQHLTDQFPEQTVNLPPRLRQHYDRSEGA